MDFLPAMFRITFKGRINRFRFFVYLTTILLILLMPRLFLVSVYGLKNVKIGNLPTFALYLNHSIEFVAYVYFFSLGTRRLHDLGRSGWLLLIALLPIISNSLITLFALIGFWLLFSGKLLIFLLALAIFLYLALHIYLLFTKGTVGANKYGDDPLEYDSYGEYLDSQNIVE
jgi:Predicted membrane protein